MRVRAYFSRSIAGRFSRSSESLWRFLRQQDGVFWAPRFAMREHLDFLQLESRRTKVERLKSADRYWPTRRQQAFWL